jgi:hypothetical protein
MAPAGIVAVGDMNATAGLLLVNVKVVSVSCAAAIATRAVAPPEPVVCATSIDQSEGGTAGSSVTRFVTETPFHVAVIVTGVATATWLVWMANGRKKLPPGAVTVAGTTASGELLDRVMVAPPAAMLPLNAIVAPPVAPPVTRFGDGPMFLSDVGSTVKTVDTAAPPYDAVTVAAVDVAT